MFTQCYSLSFEISARIAFSLILNQEDVNGQEEYESAWIYLMDSILIRKTARLMDILKRIAARFVLVLDNFY
jgi:hypothetical protein